MTIAKTVQRIQPNTPLLNVNAATERKQCRHAGDRVAAIDSGTVKVMNGQTKSPYYNYTETELLTPTPPVSNDAASESFRQPII